MNLMSGKRIRHLPVLDHGKVVGLLSIGDLVQATIETVRPRSRLGNIGNKSPPRSGTLPVVGPLQPIVCILIVVKVRRARLAHLTAMATHDNKIKVCVSFLHSHKALDLVVQIKY